MEDKIYKCLCEKIFVGNDEIYHQHLKYSCPVYANARKILEHKRKDREDSDNLTKK